MVLIATLLSLSLLVGCKKDAPKADPKDGEPADKDGDSTKDVDPRKDREAKKPVINVPYWPTADEVVEKMLEVAELSEKDVLYDLGCGDGRIVIAAAKKYRCKAIGYDIDPARIKDSEANKAKQPPEVQALISFVEADVLTLELSAASVITVYLSDEMLEKLTPAFKKLKAGSRIVSHNRLIPGADKDKGFPVYVAKKNGYEAALYRYTAPLKVDE